MQLDILIFIIITVFLALKLKSLLGTKQDGDTNVALNEYQQAMLKKIIDLTPAPVTIEELNGPVVIDANILKGDVEKINEGLKEIVEVDKSFSADEFVEGAKQAFEIIVEAYDKGNCEELKPLLSPNLYHAFEGAINAKSLRGEDGLGGKQTINSAHITEAHQGGVMAYVTIEYSVTKNMNGADKQVTDIWTFTRDTRSEDPNWMLIETRTA